MWTDTDSTEMIFNYLLERLKFWRATLVKCVSNEYQKLGRHKKKQNFTCIFHDICQNEMNNICGES